MTRILERELMSSPDQETESNEKNEISEKDLGIIEEVVEKENKNYPVWKNVIKPHTQRVYHYAKELCIGEGLTKESRFKVLAAVQAHDAVKADPEINLLDHGEESAEFIENKLLGMGKSKELAKEIGDAVRRHMVYPFLVKLAKKLKHPDFPQPQTKIDKIVYDADVLDNISIKNIAFRLDAEKGKRFIDEDVKTAQEKGITQLQAAMENVIESVDEAVVSLKTDAGKRIGNEMFDKLKKAVSKLNYSEIQVGKDGQVDARITFENLQKSI